VTRECVRVLKPSGSLWVNLGDKYAGATTATGGSTANGGRRERRRARTASWVRARLGRKQRRACPQVPHRHPLALRPRLHRRPRPHPPRRSHLVQAQRAARVRHRPGTPQPRAVVPLHPRAAVLLRGRRDPRGAHPARQLSRQVRRPSQGPRAGPTGLGQAASRQGEPEPKAMFNPLGKLPGSVWTVPTEPLRVPDHLGIDHFAAFPTEWPRRIIQGWSPAGVCVECGEGRRPVSDASDHGVRGPLTPGTNGTPRRSRRQGGPQEQGSRTATPDTRRSRSAL
jgi:hypothetical protein